MIALRFQTGGGHQTSLASLRGTIKGDCWWKQFSWLKNVQFTFQFSCSIWFFYQYLCHRNTFLLYIWLYWAPQDAAMLVSLKCTHLPHMPALFMMTHTQAPDTVWQCSWSCFHDHQTSTYCLTNVIFCQPCSGWHRHRLCSTCVQSNNNSNNTLYSSQREIKAVIHTTKNTSK